MLKNLGFYGSYYDQDISVGVLLENPLACGLDAAMMVFSVTVRDKRNKAAKPNIEDFSFYIMDEQDRIYNTQKISGSFQNIQIPAKDDEPVREPDCLIFTEFRPEFLFQDMRAVFYCEHQGQFHIINLTI